MKSAILTSFFLAVTASAAPIEITCGNMASGKAVRFSISPLERIIAYATFESGTLTAQSGFTPSQGIYDKNHLDFSGRDFLSSDLYVHATYSQFLRINHFSAITITLRKDHNDTHYKLTQFSSGRIITSGSFDELKEVTHMDFINLPCAISAS